MLRATPNDQPPSALSDNRKCPLGDVLKSNFQTCHQGLNKPLNGAPMLADYQELNAVSQ